MQKTRILGAILFIFVALSVALFGCTNSGQPNVSIDDTKDDSASVLGSETVVVKGTQTCVVTFLPGGIAEDGAEVVNEQFTCTDIMSDPRVSGAEVLEMETLVYEHHSGLWKASGTISNDNGSWRGTGTGVTRSEGISLYNYGEMIYTGEGAYTGLTYRYLIAGSDEDLVIVGWIEPVESSE